MAMPIRTTPEDVVALCAYLASKPTGATIVEAKAVVDSKVLDGRKISALKSWGFVEENGNKLRITERGRLVVKDNGARRAEAMRDALRTFRPYVSSIERVVHRHEATISATDLAAHWHQHFRDDASDSDKTLNDQAVCFFQIAQAADLGRLIVGRKGQPTRFDRV